MESVLLGKDNIPTNRRTCLLEPLNARIAALRNMADVSVETVPVLFRGPNKNRLWSKGFLSEENRLNGDENERS